MVLRTWIVSGLCIHERLPIFSGTGMHAGKSWGLRPFTRQFRAKFEEEEVLKVMEEGEQE